MSMKKNLLFKEVQFSSKATLIFFLIALGISIFLRFYSFYSLPCGLAPDESDDARWASQGKMSFVYNSPFNEAEGFYVSFLVLVSEIFGLSIWQVYSASAFLGIVTVILCFFAMKKHYGNFIATISTILLATSPWHLALSQAGNRTIASPLFLSLLLLVFPHHRQKTHWIQSIFLGLVTGLGFYGYLNYRTLPIIGLILLGLIFFRERKNLSSLFLSQNQKFKMFFFFLLGFFISLIPLSIGYLQYPNVIFSRSAQVFLLKNDFEITVKSLIKSTIYSLNGFVF